MPIASSYSAIVKLIQKGGLVANYYKTTDYQAPFTQVEAYDHNLSSYTKLDTHIDFATMEQSFLPELSYPTNFISIVWEGYLLAPHTETFIIYVNSFKTCKFAVILNDVQILTE